MKKVKILKKPPKSKKKHKAQPVKTIPTESNKFTEDYLKFYDDIKIPGKRYDW